MRNFFKVVIMLGIVAVAGTAVYLITTDKHVIVYNDGAILLVDDEDVVFLDNGTVLYKDSTVIERDEIKDYSKLKFKHLVLVASNRAHSKLNGYESGLADFYTRSGISKGLQIAIPVSILLISLFYLTRLKGKRAVQQSPPASTASSTKADVAMPKIGLPEEKDIVRFFLSLFRAQIGAGPDAKAEFVCLPSKSPGPNQIYELRVKQAADWSKRRMTIGPLGDETGSKSKCYYVIYDVHLVVKVPARPITDFELYIESIKKETAIVNKLIPKECIIPKVSVILNLLPSVTQSGEVPADGDEDRYIEWVRRSPGFQNYLKINNTFVYFMDLSQYYFLGNILDELHDIGDLITKEIVDYAEVLFEPAKFIGRYGIEKDDIFEVRGVYNRVEVDIRKLVAQSGINSNISIYQFQTWFFSALAGKDIVEDSENYPAEFVNKLNLMLKLALQKNARVIEVYRKIIKDYVFMSCYERNSAQMASITANLLDLLAWFRRKRVSMRDLKPDNLFVAGDPERYPLFLRSDKEFSLGIIDVETAVDFEQSEDAQIKQPLLGGTPFYATPSHFFRNEVLEIKYDDLGKIFHLQDWHATLVMLFKVVTGELLFERTAKLFGQLRESMINANKPQNFHSDQCENASRHWWQYALREFRTKIKEKEASLKGIELNLPQNVHYMFGKVLAKERMSLARAIKECVESQKVFDNPQIRAQLMNSSHAKTCQFKADLVNKARSQQNSKRLRKEAIVFLDQLAELKVSLGHHLFMIKLLSNPQATVSVYDIMVFMFNVVRNNMYPSQWPPLIVQSPNVCDMEDEHPSL